MGKWSTYARRGSPSTGTGIGPLILVLGANPAASLNLSTARIHAAQKFTAPASSTVGALSLLVKVTTTPNQPYRLALWADSPGTPGAILSQSASFTFPAPTAAAQWFLQILPTYTLTLGASYWAGLYAPTPPTVISLQWSRLLTTADPAYDVYGYPTGGPWTYVANNYRQSLRLYRPA